MTTLEQLEQSIAHLINLRDLMRDRGESHCATPMVLAQGWVAEHVRECKIVGRFLPLPRGAYQHEFAQFKATMRRKLAGVAMESVELAKTEPPPGSEKTFSEYYEGRLLVFKP